MKDGNSHIEHVTFQPLKTHILLCRGIAREFELGCQEASWYSFEQLFVNVELNWCNNFMLYVCNVPLMWRIYMGCSRLVPLTHHIHYAKHEQSVTLARMRRRRCIFQ